MVRKKQAFYLGDLRLSNLLLALSEKRQTRRHFDVFLILGKRQFSRRDNTGWHLFFKTRWAWSKNLIYKLRPSP